MTEHERRIKIEAERLERERKHAETLSDVVTDMFDNGTFVAPPAAPSAAAVLGAPTPAAVLGAPTPAAKAKPKRGPRKHV